MSKRQFDIGSGNEQISDDDTTTQIQIGWPAVIGVGILMAILIFCIAMIFLI